MKLRKIALLVAGVLVVAVIMVLLIWPETASEITMAVLLLAAALGGIGLRSETMRMSSAPSK